MARKSPSYLKLRRLGWYVQLAVPRDRWQAVGAKVLTRSLHTRDRREADLRKHAVIAELHSLIAQAAVSPAKSPARTAEDLLAHAIEIREEVEVGEHDPEGAAAGFDAMVDDFLDIAARRYGRNSEGVPQMPPESFDAIRRAHRVMSGRIEYTLGRQVERYLADSEHLTAQTIDDKRRWLSAFVEWFGSDREAQEVTRRVAGTYVAEVIQRRTQRPPQGERAVPLSPITRKKEVSALRSFFAWVAARGVIDTNPFDRVAGTVQESARGKAPTRRPWKSAELSKVLRGIPASDPMWSLTVLAAYSGMRREEVAQLKTSDVDGTMLRIEEGKTAAAVRRVPIHPSLRPLVRRLASTSPDGYLIPGLLEGGPDNKRAWYVGKRFGLAIRRLGIDDPALDFHALRGTVITQLEGAGIPESTIQLIVGHKRQGMTFGVYSGGVPDKVKRDAIRHVSYGRALDTFVHDTGADITVSPSAKARGRREK